MEKPTVQTLAVSDARQQLSQLLNRVFRHEVRIVVEKNGIPVAAIIAADDLARLTALETQRRERFAVLDAVQSAFADIPADELEREVQRALEDVRQENRGGNAD